MSKKKSFVTLDPADEDFTGNAEKLDDDTGNDVIRSHILTF